MKTFEAREQTSIYFDSTHGLCIKQTDPFGEEHLITLPISDVPALIDAIKAVHFEAYCTR